MITRAKLIAARPTLFHYTAKTADPLIREHGLWSTAELARQAGSDDVLKLRSEFEDLDVPTIGRVRISHNQPMLRLDGTLKETVRASLCLGDVSQQEWSDLLSARVFFFGRAANLSAHSGPPANGYVRTIRHGGPVVELAVSTEILLHLCEAEGRALEASRHNSGSAPRSPVMRNRSTWQPWQDFDGTSRDVVEFTVEVGISKIATAIVGARQIRQQIPPGCFSLPLEDRTISY
jgi:hypothetical protein